MERCRPVMALSSRVGAVFDEEPYDIEPFLGRLFGWCALTPSPGYRDNILRIPNEVGE